MSALVPDEFLINLRVAIAWCKARVDVRDPKYCLRSRELRPEIDFDEDPPWDVDLWLTPELVRPLVVKRAKLVAARDVAIPEPASLLEEGRLLLHFMDYSNHNGLTAGITDYFLDNNDSPPWDTWVQALQIPESETSDLVSWVPGEFVRIVDTAIKSECIGMLMWAADGNRWWGGGVPDWLTRLG